MYKIIIIFLILFSVISKSVQIINGNKTSIDTYHWMASINVGNWLPYYAQYTCAGTIIGSKWVITSAHCQEDIPWWSPSYYFNRVGSNDPEWHGDTINVKNWIKHKDYDAKTQANDAAVMELVSEIEWIYPTHPIELVNQEFEIIDGLVVRTAAFGDTCDDCGTSSQLYELVQTTCTPLTYLGTNLKKFDDGGKETVMCSEDLNEKSTVCNGDSGAGFIINISNQNFLLGIVSHTTQFNCNPQIPVFSASIPAYREWIRNVTGI